MDLDPPRHLLSSEEMEALDLTGKLASLCRRIVGDGPEAVLDWNELAGHIHVVQRTILAQAAARAFPGEFRLLGADAPRDTVRPEG